jgi:hypothetical protein
MMVKKKKIEELRNSIKTINRKKGKNKQFLGHYTKAKA